VGWWHERLSTNVRRLRDRCIAAALLQLSFLQFNGGMFAVVTFIMKASAYKSAVSCWYTCTSAVADDAQETADYSLKDLRLRLQLRRRCPIIGSPLRRQKSLPGRHFTGKNSPRSAASRAGRIFAGKLSARGHFLGDPKWDFFMGPAIIWQGRDILNPWLSLPGRIFRWGDISMWHRQHTQQSHANDDNAAPAG